MQIGLSVDYTFVRAVSAALQPQFPGGLSGYASTCSKTETVWRDITFTLPWVLDNLFSHARVLAYASAFTYWIFEHFGISYSLVIYKKKLLLLLIIHFIYKMSFKILNNRIKHVIEQRQNKEQ